MGEGGDVGLRLTNAEGEGGEVGLGLANAAGEWDGERVCTVIVLHPRATGVGEPLRHVATQPPGRHPETCGIAKT